MWAITSTSYRAIGDGDTLGPDETVAAEVPASLLAGIAAAEGRSLREQRLRASDWTQMADAQLSPQVRELWITYRQQLRDLPEVDGFPDCEWPTEPVT
jgi:hypothetical protein